MNYDMTFCLSDKCSHKLTCDRYFYNHSSKINKQVSLNCFYKEHKPCEYYIKLEGEE